MAEVIRRIEAIYSAPRFDDSDEDDASRRRGRVEDAASASDDDDDLVDDGRDPNDPAVIAGEEAAKPRARAKATKKAKQQKRKTPIGAEEWYDVDDDFIDDEELDEYFERNGRKDKLGGSGRRPRYVRRRELEFEDDGTGRRPGGGGTATCEGHPRGRVRDGRHRVDRRGDGGAEARGR